MIETSNKCGYLKIGTSSIGYYRDLLKKILEYRFICEKGDGLPRFRFIPCKALEFIERFERGLTEFKNLPLIFLLILVTKQTPIVSECPSQDLVLPMRILNIILYCLLGLCFLLGFVLIFEKILYVRKKRNLRSEMLITIQQMIQQKVILT